MLSKANCFWGDCTIHKANAQIFSAQFRTGSLLTSFNTHHVDGQNLTVYPNILHSGVCQWIQPTQTHQATHIANDHLGRYAATQMLGPSGRAIVFITAYHPVNNSKNSGMLTVMAQHKRVLGQFSNPQLGIDANETMKQDGTPPDNAISKFCLEAGQVDAIHEIHGQCPIPSCDRSSGTPIDFMFCSLALLPFIRVGMLPSIDGGASDHRAFGIDIKTSTIWGGFQSKIVPQQKGVQTKNKTKTSEYVAEVHRRATEHKECDKVEAASLAAINGEPIGTTGRLLDEADATITRALLGAEKAMLPSQRARSHHWIPEQVKAQQKAALVTKFCRAAMIRKTSFRSSNGLHVRHGVLIHCGPYRRGYQSY